MIWDSLCNDYEGNTYCTIKYMVWVRGLLDDLIIEGLMNREGLSNLAKFCKLSIGVNGLKSLSKLYLERRVFVQPSKFIRVYTLFQVVLKKIEILYKQLEFYQRITFGIQ